MAGQDSKHPFYLFYYLGPVDGHLAERTRHACETEAWSPKPFYLPFSWSVYSKDMWQDIAESPGQGIGDPTLTPVSHAPAVACAGSTRP